jgi:hypothetical protein
MCTSQSCRTRWDLTLAIGVINTYNRLAIGFRKTPEVAKAD